MSECIMKDAMRMPLLDPLRIMLALMVMVTHCFGVSGMAAREPLMRLTGGYIKLGDVAVDAFFIVSGLLISISWDRSKPLDFMRKRVLRIYPAFLFVSAVCFWAAFGPDDAWRSALLLKPPPETLNGRVIDEPSWTIAYEFCCYLGLGLMGLFGLLKRPAAIVAVVACAFGIYAQGALSAVEVNSIHLVDISRFIFCFGMGMLLKAYWEHIPSGRLVSGVVVAAVLISIPLHYVNLVWPFAIAYCVSLLARKPADTSWLRGTDPSYGIYLYHFPVVLMMHTVIPHSPWLLALTCGMIATVLGAASWWLLERPAQRIKFHFVRRPTINDPHSSREYQQLVP